MKLWVSKRARKLIRIRCSPKSNAKNPQSQYPLYQQCGVSSLISLPCEDVALATLQRARSSNDLTHTTPQHAGTDLAHATPSALALTWFMRLHLETSVCSAREY